MSFQDPIEKPQDRCLSIPCDNRCINYALLVSGLWVGVFLIPFCGKLDVTMGVLLREIAKQHKF